MKDEQRREEADAIEFGRAPTITDLGGGRTWTPDMGEISGFGGSYEDHCRKMLRGGLDWLDAHPKSDPVFRGYKGVFGVVTEDNEDARGLTEAIAVAGGNDFTGAMHHAVVGICLYVRKNGWEAFAKAKRDARRKDDEARS